MPSAKGELVKRGVDFAIGSGEIMLDALGYAFLFGG